MPYAYHPAESAVSVSEINRYIKTLFENSDILNGIAVRGEISNFKRHTSGHLYFSLKDEEGLLRAVMFRSSAVKLSFQPQDGMKVIARGDIGVYVRDGQYQLYVTSLVPDGVGALYQAFEQLKRKLEAEGLFDPERKKPIPAYPKKIGIITSETGAAIHDMINILTRRYPVAQIYLCPAEVQGAGAPMSLISALRFFEEMFAVDVIIIGRGGGSIEDLWAFNDEQLARCIACCHTPVISAVGHESDFTICDFVADMRAPTPSAAAELATPDREELLQRLQSLSAAMAAHLRRGLLHRKTELQSLEKRACFRYPERLCRDRQLALAALTEKLQMHLRADLARRAAALDTAEARLKALDPSGVLQRGYCILRDTSGHAVTDANALHPGDCFTLELADGYVDARAEKINLKNGSRS